MRPLLLAAFLVVPVAASAQSWCGASGLNPAEQAICSDPVLGDLDAELTSIWSAERRGSNERRHQREWLSERNACGYDVFCIEEAYHARIDALLGYGDVDGGFRALRLPWCGASSLNAAEATICADDYLANLDAAMTAVYGAARAADGDREQQQWIRSGRDACGTDRACLGAAYLSRIAELGGRLRAN